MPYFTSHNTPLYYETRGRGPVLLFISPPGLGCAAFEQQHPLEDQFQVVTFDPRGNGKSERGETADGTIRQWTEDMYALISHLEADQVVLCGYSLGGLPAQEFAYNYPEKTAALVLISGFPKVKTFLLAGKFRIGIWSTYENMLGTLGRGLAFSHTKQREQQTRIEKNIENSDPGVLEQMYISGRHYDSTGFLPSITCPVLTIFGSNDVFVKKHQHDFQSRLARMHNVHIQGKAHQLPTRAASEVNAIIKNFVNSSVFVTAEQT